MKSSINPLALLILGLCIPGRDTDIFLKLLIEKLQYSWEEGCEMCAYVRVYIYASIYIYTYKYIYIYIYACMHVCV